MAAKLFERLAGTTFKLRAVIGFAFTLILLLSAGSLVWLDHQGSLRLLQKQIDQQFDILVSSVTSQVALQFDSAGAVLDTLALNSPPMRSPQADGATLVRVLASLATTSPAALSIIMAGQDGRYVLVQRLRPAS